MDKIYCAYHPTKPALWFCAGCDAYFCSECITKKELGGFNKKTTMHLCPKCSSMAERLAVENIVEPFWSRLPKIFAYPLKTHSMIFMVTLSIFMTLFSSPDLFSKIIQSLLLGVLLKYCFSALKATAQGSMKAPEINEQTISEDFGVVVKYWGLGFLFFLAGMGCFLFTLGISANIGTSMGIFLFVSCIIFLLMIYPAMVIVLATSDSLLSAINPSISVRMAWRIGPSYLLMLIFLVFLYSAPATVVYLLQPFIPNILIVFMFALANCYYTIVAHHLMGYLILQYHDTIGYDVDPEEQDIYEQEHAPEKDAAHNLINRLNVLIKESRLDDAIELIQAEMKPDMMNPDVAERYYNLLKLKDRTPEMLAHAKVYLDLLVKGNRKDTFRAVYLECVAIDPGFCPRATTLFKIAGSMNECGNFHAALEAYNRFIKGSPDDPLVPKAYFLAAGVFYEKMLNPEKASKTLQRLIRIFPNHEIVPYAQRYLRQIGQQG